MRLGVHLPDSQATCNMLGRWEEQRHAEAQEGTFMLTLGLKIICNLFTASEKHLAIGNVKNCFWLSGSGTHI